MLSNKLTFSLTFIVMLVFGLALTATPALAGYLSAALDIDSGSPSTNGQWTVQLYLPITADDVEHDGTALQVITPVIKLDTGTGTLTDITLGNSRAGTVSVSTPSIFGAETTGEPDADQNSAPVRASLAKFARYTITFTRDTVMKASTFTYSDYTTVTLNISLLDSDNDGTPDDPAVEQDATVTLAPLSQPSDPVTAIINSFPFSIDPSVSLFHIIHNGAATLNSAGTALSNGIRVGANYVPEDALTAAPVGEWPDLVEFFRVGGTIRIVPDTGSTASGVYITEIMWGHDGIDLASAPSADNQWIEVYYKGAEGSLAPTTANLRLEFIYNRFDNTGIDYISNLSLAQWQPHGQSGHSEYGRFNGEAPVPIISMHRKRGLLINNTGGSAYNPDANFAARGELPGSWAKSEASLNMSGAFTGTPGAAHILPRVGGGHADYAKNEIPGTPLQFSEVRNDDSVDNVDWIEIRNVSDAAVNLKNYEISLVTGVSRSNLTGKRDAQGREVKRYGQLDASKKEALEHDLAIVGEDKYHDQTNNDVKRFPDWSLPAGAYLLIVNRDPSETILASGKNIEVLADTNIDDKTTNKGAGFYYFVTPRLRFSNPDTTGTPLLVMRNRVDRNEYDGKVHGDGASIIDLAGAGRHADASAKFNTEVWPLKGWKNPGGSPNIANAGVWNFVKDGNHEWWKTDGVKHNLVGYDKGVNPKVALGSPGYPNGVVKDKAADVKSGSTQPITISEIMFDASVHAGNERWNLVQWIELYNSSMTEAVNLKDWEFIIQNSNDHVDSYVDSSFRFNDLIIHPNQTVLLVSARASSEGIADRQIYNLYTQHARVLGLANRRANLLSPAGFYLKLIDKANAVVDEAGNVTVNGRQRSTADWAAMPPSEGPVRYSLVRQYGTRAEDGNGPDAPAVGTMEDGWILADLDGEGSTYYGQRGDIATPGFRTGGPLPVSLSSFRPVRDKATGEVVVRWITQSELNNAGFNILRSETKTGEFKVVNVKGIIPGHGTTSEKHVYEWKDTTAKPNVVYYYQIEDVSFDGQRTKLTTTRLRGHVSAAGKVTTTWGDLKTQN